MKLFMLAIYTSVAFVLILLKGTQFNSEFLLARAAEYMLHVSAGTMWVASLYSASLSTSDLNSLILFHFAYWAARILGSLFREWLHEN